MKARIEINRREDLRAGHISYSIWKALHGNKAKVELEHYVMTPKVGKEEQKPTNTWQEQRAILREHLAHLKRKDNGGQDAS